MRRSRERGSGAGASGAGAAPASSEAITDSPDTNPTNPTKAKQMAVKFGSLRADVAKEQQGDWVDVPDLPGVSLKVKSFNDPAYRVQRDLLVQRMARKHGKKSAAPEEMESAFGKLYADYILLDWRGFDEPYTAELARGALTDPAYRDLRRYVESAASQVGTTDVEFVEESLGESKRG
jgi:hypothetical protein